MGLALAAWALLVATGCTREEESARREQPIRKQELPTPLSEARPGLVLAKKDADAAPTPLPAHTPSPVAPGDSAPGPITATPESGTSPVPTADPPAGTAAAPAAPRKGVVARGTDLRDGPGADAPILGTFQGRTNVEVIAEAGDFVQVRSPVIGGGDVEGWVAAGSVADPAKIAAAPKPRSPAAPAAPPGPAKPPAAAKAVSTGDAGPDDILLVPIAGTAKKRPATPFTHKAHYDDYGYACEICHHPVKALGGKTGSYTCSTAGCHVADQCNGQPVGRKNAACPNFEDAFHIQCIDCHKADGGPTRCSECHTG